MTTGDGPYDGGASEAGGRDRVSPVPEPGPRGASRVRGGGFGRWEVVYLVFVAGCLWLFATVIIQDFHNPILGAGDRNIAGYLGYYVAHNLHLWPVPHLGLTNDQMLYPYGNTHVFLSWAFEQDLLWTVLDRLFGNGPWLQVYFLLSVAITVVGSYLLARREWGPLRAAYLSFVVGFGSYAAIWRWPFHASLALIHWTVLNVVADAIIARRVWLRRPLSARLLLVRAALVVLCLGLDLGYVAGMALTSLLVTAVFVTAVVWRRSESRWPFTPSRIAGWRRALAASWAEHRVQNAAIALIAAVAAWLLVPLVLEVALTARRYDFSKIPDHVWWSNPIRLLIPIFPGFNPMMLFRLGDSPEGQFSGSPGIFFVLAAALGLATAKKGERGATLPLLALLGLFLAYQPRVVPLQHVLPWFQFDRVTGRFALIYPTILALVSLAVPTGLWRRAAGKVAIIALGGVLAVEGATAYSLVLIRPLGNFVPDRSFRNLMSAIATAPGEAVMEWPFCVAAGNGIGTGELCPFYNVQAGLFGLRQLHGKKIVSQYYGRSHPSQIEPLVAGRLAEHVPGRPAGRRARKTAGEELPSQRVEVPRKVLSARRLLRHRDLPRPAPAGDRAHLSQGLGRAGRRRLVPGGRPDGVLPQARGLAPRRGRRAGPAYPVRADGPRGRARHRHDEPELRPVRRRRVVGPRHALPLDLRPGSVAPFRHGSGRRGRRGADDVELPAAADPGRDQRHAGGKLRSATARRYGTTRSPCRPASCAPRTA